MFRLGTSKIISAASAWKEALTVNMANSSIGSQKKFSTESLNVQHEPKKSRFVINLGNAEAVLEYIEGPPGILDMYHTGVPVELQGKGIAKILAQEAFNYIVKNDLKMKLSCSYLQKYLHDNPKHEFKQRVVQ